MEIRAKVLYSIDKQTLASPSVEVRVYLPACTAYAIETGGLLSKQCKHINFELLRLFLHIIIVLFRRMKPYA